MIQTRTVKTVNFGPLRNLDLSAELNDCALIVKKDIQNRYAKDINLDGTQTKALEPATINAKRGYKKKARATIKALKETGRKDLVAKSKSIGREASSISRYAEKPLVATTSMWYNQIIKKATKTRQRVEITIGDSSKFGEKSDSKVYSFHHTGGGHLPARPKFGIGNGVDDKISRYIALKIKAIVRRLGG